MAESAPTATIRRDTPSMADTRPELELALEFVWSIDLPYPDGQLLQCFLQDSIDPVQAAGYMLQRCYVEGDGRNLRTFVSDWKQLINVCMIDMCTSDQVSGRAILMTNSCLRRPDLPTS